MTLRPIIYISMFFLTIYCVGCTNHINKYKVNIDSLLVLPDGFYAYRRGRAYCENIKTERFVIWFDLDDDGNIENVFKITDFKRLDAANETVIRKYGIDTSSYKTQMQQFINLSKKYKFGHIYVDRNNKIIFSYKNGLFEQYVKTFNDSTRNVYLKDKDFRLLDNGWFENRER